MAESTISADNSPRPDAVAAVLAIDPLACRILRFLVENECAMDTAKGIAAWWVQHDEIAVLPSLHRLFGCGAIRAHSLTSGVTVYGLTANSEVRAWLRTALGVSGAGKRDPKVL